jgi:anti-sigma B factor antagonist
VIVPCAAELDLTNVPALRKALRAARRAGPVVVVDMSRTAFCDASVVRALVEADDRATARRGELWLVVTSPALTRILAVMGVDRRLRIVSRLPEALSTRSETTSELPVTLRSGGESGKSPALWRRVTKAPK